MAALTTPVTLAGDPGPCRFYRRLLQTGVNSAALWNNLGLCCFAAGQYDMTVVCYERCGPATCGHSTCPPGLPALCMEASLLHAPECPCKSACVMAQHTCTTHTCHCSQGPVFGWGRRAARHLVQHRAAGSGDRRPRPGLPEARGETRAGSHMMTRTRVTKRSSLAVGLDSPRTLPRPLQFQGGHEHGQQPRGGLHQPGRAGDAAGSTRHCDGVRLQRASEPGRPPAMCESLPAMIAQL